MKILSGYSIQGGLHLEVKAARDMDKSYEDWEMLVSKVINKELIKERKDYFVDRENLRIYLDVYLNDGDASINWKEILRFHSKKAYYDALRIFETKGFTELKEPGRRWQQENRELNMELRKRRY